MARKVFARAAALLFVVFSLVYLGETAVGVTALVMGVACVGAGIYIRLVYRQRRREAPFLTRMVERDDRVSFASLLLSGLVAYSYLGDPLPRPWGAVVIGVAVLLYEWGPISDALTFRVERRLGREAGSGGNPDGEAQ